MDDVIAVIGGLELFALTLGFWAFTLLFHVLSDWKASAMGRHFMSFMVAASVVLGWAWLGYAFELPYMLRAFVRLIVYGVLAVIVWRQVRILVRMQVIARSKPEEVPRLSTLEETHDGPVT